MRGMARETFLAKLEENTDPLEKACCLCVIASVNALVNAWLQENMRGSEERDIFFYL